MNNWVSRNITVIYKKSRNLTIRDRHTASSDHRLSDQLSALVIVLIRPFGFN